jgi:hypothetical protein
MDCSAWHELKFQTPSRKAGAQHIVGINNFSICASLVTSGNGGVPPIQVLRIKSQGNTESRYL